MQAFSFAPSHTSKGELFKKKDACLILTKQSDNHKNNLTTSVQSTITFLLLSVYFDLEECFHSY